MTDKAPDGLAALSAQRERARRTMPPPRHPVHTLQQTLAVPQRPDETLADPEQPRDDVPEQGTPATTSPPAPTRSVEGTVRVTLYVDRSADEYMEAVRVAGLTARPKVDVSRSAVVRLALRQLMNEMSPAEAKAILGSQPVQAGIPGRKRR